MPPSPSDYLLNPVVALPDLRLIRVSGNDRVGFLQGQLTQDVRRAAPAAAVLCGWTTAQGRLLLVSWLFSGEDALYLTVPAQSAADLLRRLRMFVLRAAVTAELTADVIHGITGESALAQAAGAPGEGHLVRLPGPDARGLLIPLAGEAPPAWPTGSATWLLADIRAGIPSIATPVSDAFVPQMVNLDLLDGVSFSKGCYSGQEIITRTRHLGRLRRRMFRFALAGEAVPAPGEVVLTDDREVGRVVCAGRCDDGCELLAVIQLDAKDDALHLAASPGRPLKLLPLPYAIPD